MKHCYRFLAKIDANSSSKWLVTGDELFHMRKVLHLAQGAQIEIFDGNGYCAQGTIESFAPDRATIKTSDELAIIPHLQKSLTLALGALRPGTIDEALPSLTELGVTQLHVFLQDGLSKNRITDKAQARWKRIVLAAAKQCKTQHLPKIDVWPSLEKLLDHLDEKEIKTFFLDPHASRVYGDGPADETRIDGTICGIIASEKGFVDHEICLLKIRQAQAVRLNTPILRSFSASIALASLMQHMTP